MANSDIEIRRESPVTEGDVDEKILGSRVENSEQQDVALTGMTMETKQFMQEAINAETADLRQGPLEAAKRNPRAIAWCIGVSMLVVMEAFDQDISGSLNGMNTYRKKFGNYVPASKNYQLTAPWQSALANSNVVGAVIGNLLSGPVVNKLGYRYTGLIGLFFLTGFIFLSFFAQNLGMLFTGKLLSAVSWGLFITIGPAYASEIAPVNLRGALTLWIQACWSIGNFVQSGIVYATQSRNDDWSWRIPFACEWIWPIPLALILIFAPESPWWLVRKDRIEDAERALTRLGTARETSPREVIASMQRTIEIEKQVTVNVSYWDCLKGTDRRRTIICALVYISQHYCAYNLNGTYFLEQAGFPASQSFALSLGSVGIQLCACLCCLFLVSYFGRRTLFMFGNATSLVFLIAIGTAASQPNQGTKSRWVQAVFSILIVIQYGLTIGPVTYAIIAEVSSIRLRAHTVAIGKACSFTSLIPVNFINSYALNPSAWNLHGRAAWIWAGTTAVVIVLGYFGLPEFKGRSYRELDILFHRKVAARKFSKTQIGDDENE